MKQTINLPKTAFSMKANLPQTEPKMLERWEREKEERFEAEKERKEEKAERKERYVRVMAEVALEQVEKAQAAGTINAEKAAEVRGKLAEAVARVEKWKVGDNRPREQREEGGAGGPAMAASGTSGLVDSQPGTQGESK